MSINIHTTPPPIREDATGALRVGQTRVLLELVVRAFQDGATPEAIVQRYATTSLAEVYGVVAYYLHHTKEIEEYLAEREAKASEVQQKIESRQGDLGDLRRRLLGRHRAYPSVPA